MEIVYERVAAIDVGKEIIAVAVRTPGERPACALNHHDQTPTGRAEEPYMSTFPASYWSSGDSVLLNTIQSATSVENRPLDRDRDSTRHPYIGNVNLRRPKLAKQLRGAWPAPSAPRAGWRVQVPLARPLPGISGVVTPIRRLPLRFAEHAVTSETHVNLSAVRTDGRWLWIAGDETATVERLTRLDTAADGYGAHATFPLADVVSLPGQRDEEIDIEGLGRRGPYLWAVGSHSRKRKRVKAKHDDAKSLRRLATVSDEPSRRVLARLAIREDPDRSPVIAPEGSAVLGEPGLVDMLSGDEHLGPFLGVPGKDNGFDIEGVAAHGEPGAETLYLGLRGPVLRGWAGVLEIRPREDGPGRLRLDPVDGPGDSGVPYRIHVLDLGGLGVRDLCPDGADLLVLAGPSMDLDGPVRLYRWADAAQADSRVVRPVPELDLPFGDGDDHAEGIALLDGGELLVVYDSPAPSRLAVPAIVLADVVSLR